MAEASRRTKFSVLTWPSLYSLRAILLTPLVFALVVGLVMLVFYLSRQSERTLMSRASERVRAVMALKLSGAGVWQWKRELTCENQRGDCLRVEFSFSQPLASGVHSQIVTAPRACKVCHAKGSENDLTFYTTFPDIPAGKLGRFTEWAILILLALAAIALVIYLLLLRRRRLRSGVCIVAFEHDHEASEAVRNFIVKLAASHFSSYYGDIGRNRARIATTPEKLRAILSQNHAFLEANRGSLRSVALHVSLAEASLIPVEVLRAAFQFLARTPARTYLLQERLVDELGEDYENGRRLVFKNKSGASVKFVPWTPSQELNKHG